VTSRHPPSGPAFWWGLLAGWALILFGVAGVLGDANRTAPLNLGLWFAGSALVHDFLVAPAVFAVAFVLARLLPSSVRPAVQASLVVAAPVVVVALPLVLGQGGAAGNPSALPRNYAGGLFLVLAAIAAVTALAIRVRRMRTNPVGATKPSQKR
jgi:hypothetical protein